MLRNAGADDAGALAELAERTFRDTFAPSNSAEDMAGYCRAHFGRERQRAEIADPGWATVVADEDGALVAFGQLRFSDAPACIPGGRPREILRFYVDKSRHGQGLAPKLMGALLERAADAGADGVWLGVWEHNPRAIAFYKKAGFREVGEHAFALGSDLQRDVLMYRALR
ncbi:MAG TPA: GNAT family N-acetyltransferase [Woeseiaceae bacterium]|nr:GNAT family N-acetyltransferase [Woeseiaceae bacterium]